MAEVIYGTSSWSEKSWVGSFYPEGTKPAGYLPLYAKEFRAVEADTTYYGIPKPSTVEGWVARTPPGFRMCAKFPKTIVHGGEGARPDPKVLLLPERVQAETDEFLETMRLLGDRCGPLVLQFPYFNKGIFAGAGPFLDRLGPYLESLPRDFRYAVEVRNRSYVRPPLLNILKRNGVALVLVEIGYLPHPAEIDFDLVTADFCYARLIGDRKEVEAKTKTFDKIVVDRSGSLDRWADLLYELAKRVPETWVFANNHYAGHGPTTIRDLVARLEERAAGT